MNSKLLGTEPQPFADWRRASHFGTIQAKKAPRGDAIPIIGGSLIPQSHTQRLLGVWLFPFGPGLRLVAIVAGLRALTGWRFGENAGLRIQIWLCPQTDRQVTRTDKPSFHDLVNH